MKHFSLLLATGLVAGLGCGENLTYRQKGSEAPPPAAPVAAQFALQPAAEAKPAPPPADLLARKIVYTAEMIVIVEDFDRAEEAFKQLISQQKGSYVAQAEVTGSAGSPRKGHWKIRVPVGQFETFVEAVTKLGVPERNSIDSKDVLGQYHLGLGAELRVSFAFAYFIETGFRLGWARGFGDLGVSQTYFVAAATF